MDQKHEEEEEEEEVDEDEEERIIEAYHDHTENIITLYLSCCIDSLMR
jgi:hypothetical protein